MCSSLLNSLPENVQHQVCENLRIFDKVYVTYENGSYRVSSSVVLKKHYAEDYKVIGTLDAVDVYSPEDRLLIYVEENHSYPIGYKGVKDWDMIRNLNWGDKVTFDKDGNIVKCKENEK